MYSVQGIFQHHFQGKKVCTILDKIQYFIKVYCFWKNLIQKVYFSNQLFSAKPSSLVSTWMVVSWPFVPRLIPSQSTAIGSFLFQISSNV